MREEDRRLPGEGIPQRLFSLTFHVEKRIRMHFRGTGLHWGLRRILQRLWIEDGLSQKELSVLTGSSETSVSNMIKNLARDEWVERRQDEFDYRISRVYVTDRAIQLRKAIEADLRDIDATLRDVLGTADADKLEQQMDRMADSFEAQLEREAAQQAKTLADMPSPPGEL